MVVRRGRRHAYGHCDGDWPGKAGGHLAYFTTIPGWLYALDAETGAQVWKVRVEDHVSTRLTGSPVVYGGRLYVPAASFEEGMSANGKYTCCSFRGSLSAFDAATGVRLWKSMMIDAPLAVLKQRFFRATGGRSFRRQYLVLAGDRPQA